MLAWLCIRCASLDVLLLALCFVWFRSHCGTEGLQRHTTRREDLRWEADFIICRRGAIELQYRERRAPRASAFEAAKPQSRFGNHKWTRYPKECVTDYIVRRYLNSRAAFEPLGPYEARNLLGRLGFSARRWSCVWWAPLGITEYNQQIAIPLWAPFALLLICVVLSARPLVRLLWRRAAGCCLHCGYDLRINRALPRMRHAHLAETTLCPDKPDRAILVAADMNRPSIILASNHAIPRLEIGKLGVTVLGPDPDPSEIGDVVINWGDGSTPETISGGNGSIAHTYSGTGPYTISLDGPANANLPADHQVEPSTDGELLYWLQLGGSAMTGTAHGDLEGRKKGT